MWICKTAAAGVLFPASPGKYIKAEIKYNDVPPSPTIQLHPPLRRPPLNIIKEPTPALRHGNSCMQICKRRLRWVSFPVSVGKYILKEIKTNVHVGMMMVIVIRCRSVIINPWQNPAAVPYKTTITPTPPPALGYNQRTHASPPAWQHLHVDLQKVAVVGIIPRVRWKIYLK